jgi:hypothetical protein
LNNILYNVTPLKTPFGLVIPLLQSQSHVTTITIIYYAAARLHNYNPCTYVTTVTYSTLARIHSLRALHSNLYCTVACSVGGVFTVRIGETVRWELCCVTVFTAALPWKRSRCCVTSSVLRGEDSASPHGCADCICHELFGGRCLATRNNIRNSIVACVYSVAGCVT